MNEAQDAVAFSIEFEAKKDKCTQLQSGEWTLTLKLHPDQVSQELMLAAPGQRYVCVLVAVGDDEKALAPEQTPTTNGAVEKEAKPKRQWDDIRPTEQAGIRCNDLQFQEWIAHHHKYGGYKGTAQSGEYPRNREGAADYVRAACHVASRSELNSPLCPGQEFWYEIDSKYRAETQQTAEVR